MQEKRRKKRHHNHADRGDGGRERERQKRQNGGACGVRMIVDVLGIKRRMLVWMDRRWKR